MQKYESNKKNDHSNKVFGFIQIPFGNNYLSVRCILYFMPAIFLNCFFRLRLICPTADRGGDAMSNNSTQDAPSFSLRKKCSLFACLFTDLLESAVGGNSLSASYFLITSLSEIASIIAWPFSLCTRITEVPLSSSNSGRILLIPQASPSVKSESLSRVLNLQSWHDGRRQIFPINIIIYIS